MTKPMIIPSSTPHSSSPDNVWLSRWKSVSQFDDQNYRDKKHFQSSHYISSCSSVSTMTTRDADSESFDEESEDETSEKWMHSSSTHSLLSGSDKEQHSLFFAYHHQNSKRSRNIQINTHDLKDYSLEESPPKRQTSPLMRPAARYAPNFNFEFSTGSFPPQAYSDSVQKSRRSMCATLGIFKPLSVCLATDRSGYVGEVDLGTATLNADQEGKDEEGSEEEEELVEAAHASSFLSQ